MLEHKISEMEKSHERTCSPNSDVRYAEDYDLEEYYDRTQQVKVGMENQYKDHKQIPKGIISSLMENPIKHNVNSLRKSSANFHIENSVDLSYKRKIPSCEMMNLYPCLISSSFKSMQSLNQMKKSKLT